MPAKIEDLRKKKAEAEDVYRNSMPASSYQQQKLRVCEVCSAYLGIHDNDRRLADHFGGKLHLGFIKIRDKLAELEKTVEERRQQKRSEKDRDYDRDDRDRSRDRSRDRDRYRDRSRDRSRERSSRRRRSRTRSRSKSRHSSRSNVLNWIHSYLGGRQHLTRIGNDSSLSLARQWGVPQGSCIGSICTLMTFPGVCSIVLLIHFTDDCQLHLSYDQDRLSEAVDQINSDLSLWSMTNGLGLLSLTQTSAQ
ncbi:putative RNA-binding protein Luc7-like 1 [Homalodisca vitripennis]|nr:putative RNA-binding protein Luc7-like 1 [Homalodisca vitripennis]